MKTRTLILVVPIIALAVVATVVSCKPTPVICSECGGDASQHTLTEIAKRVDAWGSEPTLRVFTLKYADRTYLLNSQGGIVEVTTKTNEIK